MNMRRTVVTLHLAGKMKSPPSPGTRGSKNRRRRQASSFLGALLVLLVVTFFYTASSASLIRKTGRNGLNRPAPAAQTVSPETSSRNKKTALNIGSGQAGFSSLAWSPFQQLSIESIATYAADCVTPKTVFQLGEVVCAKASNAPLRRTAPLRRISFGDTIGNVRNSVEITVDPQTALFTLPTTDTTNIDAVDVNNRGVWGVSINSTGDYSTRAIAYFSVRDAANPAADLAIYNTNTTRAGAVSPGGSTGFQLVATNTGPDNALNVHITVTDPPNLTFANTSQSSGPAFSCTNSSGVTDCSISSLTSGSDAFITVNYTVDAGAPTSFITTTANITSGTTDQHADNNSSDAGVNVVSASGGSATCSLSCPANVTAFADTTQNGQAGAVVTFDSGDAVGDCGAITATPASGTFFPVGTTTVDVTSDHGGGACSFTVTVVENNPPTISCPGNQTVTAADGSCSATVDPGVPTYTGTGVTVAGVRSDGLELSDPYPGGTTTITWTATDDIERTATCTQTITVNVNDTTPPTISAPPDVTASTTTDGCSAVVDDNQLGAATASDNCGTVKVERTGVPAGNVFPLGSTSVTYKATDGAGNSTTAVQHVVVNDTTAPIITAPPSASYSCPSEVPAADPSQATGLDGEGPPTDNCGTPVVSVSETRSGAGSASSPLVITRTYTATDASHNSASATQTITVIDSTPPTISAPANVTVSANDSCAATDVALGSPTTGDNCSVASVTNNAPASFSLGQTVVTWTVADAAGNTATANQTVTVVDTTPPSVTPPAPMSASADASCMAAVPNVVSGTQASDNCTPTSSLVITQSPAAGTLVSAGVTAINVTASDAAGNTTTKQVAFTVIDSTPPTMTLSKSSMAMWPPNHQYQTVNVTDFVSSVSDNCSSLTVNDVVIENVSSDEPADNPSGGDGNTLNDIVINSGCKSVQLRAERDGGRDGRVYTITFAVKDAGGNVTRQTVTVAVPVNQIGTNAVNSGAAYTVQGCSP
jgi:hypothetical protein